VNAAGLNGPSYVSDAEHSALKPKRLGSLRGFFLVVVQFVVARFIGSAERPHKCGHCKPNCTTTFFLTDLL
jgi:hypothetical protein